MVDKSAARSVAVQSEQLLTERQVFEKEILPGAEPANQPANEVAEREAHDENLIAMSDSTSV